MRLVFDHVLFKSGICSVNGNFLRPALSQGPCLEPLHAHGLCPLTDSLKGTISSAGAGGKITSPPAYTSLPFQIYMFALLCLVGV